MIFKFWLNADFFDKQNSLVLDDSNIKDIEYAEFKKGWFKLAFEKGKLIDISELPEIYFYYSSSKGNQSNVILLNSFGLTIVHDTVRQVFLENKVTGIQYIPITIKDRDSKNCVEGYYILNFLNVVDAINLELSEYDYFADYNIYTFWGNRICFNGNKVNKLDIFKDVKSPKSIFVSQKIKDIFSKNGWAEMNFTPLIVC